MSKVTTDIVAGWCWRLANANGNSEVSKMPALAEWTQCDSFPSVIQMELLARKIIASPNVGENERHLQWVGEVDWEYSTSFPTPSGSLAFEHADLVLEGLDTFASVRLNGKDILRSENMFISHRVGVKAHLQPAGTRNELSILFESPIKMGNKLESDFGKRTSFMRDRRRMHIRKAQCHWGWDWGPTILTAGPYLPIRLETYDASIENIHVVTEMSNDHETANVSVTVEALGSHRMEVLIAIVDGNGQEVSKSSAKIDELGRGYAQVMLSSPTLWWPHSHGVQHLYAAKVNLIHASQTLDEKITRFGIRTIKLIQRPLEDAPGKTFLFSVNGQDLFIQGCDWIPADNFLPTISRKRYYDALRLAKFSNVNMIRVWGGGIYETDDFFDACDELGISVWQDYAFACGDYPTHPEFLDSIKREAILQTKRIRSRASLAILCGGNEDFMLADHFGTKYDFKDVKGPFEHTEFPQRKIYLDLLSDVVSELCPNVQYWANSPWGVEGANANDPTVGDIHQWSVWHFEQLPYQKYKDLSGRFVSEFGMHGFPVQRTVDLFAPDTHDRQPQSRVIDCHNKGHGAETRIARYLAENFRFDMKLENFVYCSQLLQSEAYGYSLRDWKRKFNGKGKEHCAGAIIWQFNDIYPGTSWAYVDYFMRPKPAFYSIRRTFAPISVGVERTPLSRWIDEDHPRESEIPSFSVFAHNTTTSDRSCELLIQTYDLQTQVWLDLDKQHESHEVTLLRGRNTELVELNRQESWTEESLIIVVAKLVQKHPTSRTLARIVNWPEPFRYLSWPATTKVDIKVHHATEDLKESKVDTDVLAILSQRDINWKDFVSVTTNYPVKGLWLEPIYDGLETHDDTEPLWEDNMLDLMPGETLRIGVHGLRGRGVKARFLNDWECSN